MSSIKLEDFNLLKSPVLIRNAPLKRDLASRIGFRSAFENVTTYLTKNTGKQSKTGVTHEIKTTFGKWLDQLDGDESIPYVFRLSSVSPNCDKEIEAVYSIPPMMRAYSQEFFIAAGTKADGFPLHHHINTWATSMAGTKVWFVAPPGLHPPVEPYKHHSEEEYLAAGMQHCTQKEGEIIYIPSDWWHATYLKDEWTLTVGGQGQSPGMRYAVFHGNATAVLDTPNIDMAELSEADFSAVHVAAHRGHTLVLEALAAKGFNLSVKEGGTDWTPAHVAATTGHTEVLELLAAKGVDLEEIVNSKSEAHGSTPAHMAAEKGHVDVLELLLEKGVDLTLKTRWGMAPAHLAGREGHTQVLEALTTKGVDLDAKDIFGLTPLNWKNYDYKPVEIAQAMQRLRANQEL